MSSLCQSQHELEKLLLLEKLLPLDLTRIAVSYLPILEWKEMTDYKTDEADQITELVINDKYVGICRHKNENYLCGSVAIYQILESSLVFSHILELGEFTFWPLGLFNSTLVVAGITGDAAYLSFSNNVSEIPFLHPLAPFTCTQGWLASVTPEEKEPCIISSLENSWVVADAFSELHVVDTDLFGIIPTLGSPLAPLTLWRIPISLVTQITNTPISIIPYGKSFLLPNGFCWAPQHVILRRYLPGWVIDHETTMILYDLERGVLIETWTATISSRSPTHLFACNGKLAICSDEKSIRFCFC
jgi:hypothetical protein